MGQRHDNILHKWQLGTYMRAITGAPDPIRNNPFMQAKQYRDQNQGRNLPKFDARAGILDSKGEHRMMNNERFAQIMGGLEIGLSGSCSPPTNLPPSAAALKGIGCGL